jgi:hypothetical protein
MIFLSNSRMRGGSQKSVSGSLTLVSRRGAYNGETVGAASSTGFLLRILITRNQNNCQHAAFEPIAGGTYSWGRVLAEFAR